MSSIDLPCDRPADGRVEMGDQGIVHCPWCGRCECCSKDWADQHAAADIECQSSEWRNGDARCWFDVTDPNNQHPRFPYPGHVCRPIPDPDGTVAET